MRKSSRHTLTKYVGILNKVCGDTWQSMWRYLVIYVYILCKVPLDTVFS